MSDPRFPDMPEPKPLVERVLERFDDAEALLVAAYQRYHPGEQFKPYAHVLVRAAMELVRLEGYP